MKLEVKVIELTEDEVVTILDGAMSGCAYWCKEVSVKYKNIESLEKIESLEGLAFSEKGAKALIDGNEIRFYDNEEDDIYYLSYEQLKKGVEIFIKNSSADYPITEMFTGREDSYDMDCIIQYAIFDKRIFA